MGCGCQQCYCMNRIAGSDVSVLQHLQCHRPDGTYIMQQNCCVQIVKAIAKGLCPYENPIYIPSLKMVKESMREPKPAAEAFASPQALCSQYIDPARGACCRTGSWGQIRQPVLDLQCMPSRAGSCQQGL